MKFKRFIFVIAAVLIAFCTTVKAEGPVKIVPVKPDGVSRVEIIGGGYFFKPSYVAVKVNIPVELKVSKEPGLAPHDIVAKSPEAGIEFQVSLSSTPQIIKFTPTRVGKYPIYCSKTVPFSKSHREKGMEGIIEVAP